MNKKTKLLFFSLLVFVFVFPSFNTTSNLFPIEDIKEENVEEIPKNSDTAPETVDIKSIRFVHEKGETSFLWEMVGIFYGAFNLGTYEGTYTSVAGPINGLDVYSGSTGALSGGRTIVPTMSEPAISVIQDHLDSGEFVHRFRYGYYIRPIGYSCSYPNTYYQSWVYDVEIPWTSVQTDGTLRNGIIVEYMGHKVYYAKIYWNLHPTIILDSDYYNLQNVRIEVYDQTTLEWLQQDPTDIVLQHSDYQLRIYDKNTNDLIYEDTSIIGFTFYRTITIPSIKITNNADEQIKAYVFNESTIQTDFYQYEYLDSDYESYENSSYIETFESNSFNNPTISFVNNSNDCPSLSITYKNQVDIDENNTFSIYPIKTVNDIAVVKIWNNITLTNETLTESGGYYTKIFNSSYSQYYSVEIYIEDTSGYYNIMKIDDIFVLKNRIRINLENLQNKYIQYTSMNISASLYKFDGTETTGSVNFTLKYPNGTIIIEDATPNLEYNLGYTCDYYTLTAEYFGDLDNLATSVETIFEVITPPGQSYKLIYFDEDPVFNITISPYTTEFHNLTSFSDEILYVVYFDIYNNELHGEVFNFSTTNALDYTPELLEQCRITLSDQFSNLLQFENYHVYINSEPMLSNIFYRNVDSELDITIYDLFGNLLYDDEYIVEREDNFIDLTIDQFSLKILNQLQISTILNISNIVNPLSFVLSETIAVDELLSIYVKEGDYSIYYIDDSGVEHTLSITIDESELIILNTTYHEIYFAFFDLSGFGVDSDTARFYINDERSDIGYNLIQGDTAVIKVLDFFNTEIYNDVIILTGLKEFNIYLPIYTMLINNNYTESMELSIKRQGIDVEFKQIIPAQSGISLRFLANVEYGIKIFYTNGTLAEHKSILLDEDYKQISFGFYEKIGEIHLSAISVVDFIVALVIIIGACIGFVLVGKRQRADKFKEDKESTKRNRNRRKSPGDLLRKR